MNKKSKTLLAALFTFISASLCCLLVTKGSDIYSNELHAQSNSDCCVKFGNIGYWNNTVKTKNGNEITVWMNLSHTYIANTTSIQEIRSVDLILNKDANYNVNIGENKHFFSITSNSYLDVKNLIINYSCF